jgi:hypothetical protein
MATEKLSQDELENLLKDLRWEGEWRAEADRACAYYDGVQLTTEVLRQMRERNIAPLIRNLTGPTIDLVLGIEAKATRDWKVRADKDEDVEVAEAMSAELKKAERSSNADRACSDAYASCVKSGIGWVEVARESNPFRAPYRVSNVHRREIYWDFRSKEPDLSDARYLVRKQWVDEDVVVLYFPKKAELIRKAVNRWADWDEISSSEPVLDLANSYESEMRSSIEESEWRDTDRKRLCLYEVWYRHWRASLVMVLPSGQIMEYDEQNPIHTQAVGMGMAQVRKAVFPKVRLSWWIGPHLLADLPSPYPHGYFPYVPIWAYREDSTGVPYGLVRRMMSPQDEINARLSKMMWLLSAKRVVGDSDAIDMSWQEVVEEAARPDGVILLNPNRKNKNADAVRIESDFQLSQQQFQVLQDATQAIQASAGVYQSMLGKSEYSGQSGLAINSLVEQGSTTLAELNDNYRFARKQIGTLLLSLVKEDIGNAPYTVSIESNGKRRSVLLNQPTQDEDGLVYLTNDVAHTQMTVELEDVPDTPTFRMQQLQMMTEITKSLPPELQPLLADFMVRSTDLPFRHEVADRITQALGLDQAQDPNAVDPAAAQEQALMEMQQQQMQLQLAEQEARMQKAQIDAQTAVMKGQMEQQKGMAAMAAAELKNRALQMKMVHDDDRHAASLDEQSLKMVQAAQASDEDRQRRQIESYAKQQQQSETHQLSAAALRNQQKQRAEAHKAKLQAMKRKPKPKTS